MLTLKWCHYLKTRPHHPKNQHPLRKMCFLLKIYFDGPKHSKASRPVVSVIFNLSVSQSHLQVKNMTDQVLTDIRVDVSADDFGNWGLLSIPIGDLGPGETRNLYQSWNSDVPYEKTPGQQLHCLTYCAEYHFQENSRLKFGGSDGACENWVDHENKFGSHLSFDYSLLE